MGRISGTGPAVLLLGLVFAKNSISSTILSRFIDFVADGRR